MKPSENDIDSPAHLTATDIDRVLLSAGTDSVVDPLACNEVDCYISTNEFGTSPRPEFEIDDIILDLDRVMNPENL